MDDSPSGATVYDVLGLSIYTMGFILGDGLVLACLPQANIASWRISKPLIGSG